MQRGIWTTNTAINLIVALGALCVFISRGGDILVSPAPLFGQSEGEDLPDKAPEGCEICQDALDKYWELQHKADELPVIPAYLQDEIDTARQAYLDCIEECEFPPTPEPINTPSCEELYGGSSLSVSANPKEVGSGCSVDFSAIVNTLPNKYLVKWSCGGEGETIERTANGNGDQEVTADLYVYCYGDYAKVTSASCTYTVHDPPYSISSPDYSGPNRINSAKAVLKCICSDPLPENSPDECPLTVTFDREVCKKVRLEIQGGGEIGAAAVAALKGSIGWDWERDICIASHAGGDVVVPCGWKYIVEVILYEEKAKGEIRVFSCGKHPTSSPYAAYNYSVEVSARWDSIKGD